jgi:hypothetical protein
MASAFHLNATPFNVVIMTAIDKPQIVICFLIHRLTSPFITISKHNGWKKLTFTGVIIKKIKTRVPTSSTKLIPPQCYQPPFSYMFRTLYNK